MANDENILEGHSDLEKGAYLGAIASIATADREASEEELGYIEQLCDAAKLSTEQKQLVLQAATQLSGEELNHCLDVLKKSDLKYSLVTDLIAFAKSDNNYSREEEQNVQKIAQYLGVDQKQFSLLDQFAQKAASTDLPSEEISKPSFLSSLGLQDKMQNAGINTGSLFKGLLSFAGPMILGGLLSGAMNRRSGSGGGFMPGGGGGLGSLIGMLSGGRGFGSTGGLLGRMLGGGGF
jgi:uncharacterized tellurite resistance protein B-like protein